jgi:hypothetical protein
VGLLFEPIDESACPVERHFVVVDTEEQEEPITRRSLVGAYQGGMFVRAPLVEAKQDGSIRIHNLTKVVMARSCLGLAEERLVPFETAGYIPYADDCPSAFHRISAVGLRLNGLQVIEKIGGASRARTDDLIVANDGVCQSSAFVCLELPAEYGPFRSNSVPKKSRLPGVCLNYRAQNAPIEALPKNACCNMSLDVIK